MKKVTKKVAKVQKEKSLLGLFLQALSSLYPKDAWAPGVVLAWLPKENLYYGSVARYERTHQQKEILVSVKGPTLDAVYRELAQSWIYNNQPAIDFVERVKVRRRTKR